MASIMFTCLQSQPLVVLGMLHPMAPVVVAAAAGAVAVASIDSTVAPPPPRRGNYEVMAAVARPRRCYGIVATASTASRSSPCVSQSASVRGE